MIIPANCAIICGSRLLVPWDEKDGALSNPSGKSAIHRMIGIDNFPRVIPIVASLRAIPRPSANC